MNKIELNRLSQVNNNEQNFLAALNENLKRIQEAINDTLSRTGVKPNQMEEVLDMNGNRICNVGPAVELTDVVTKQDIQNIIDAANEAIARLDGLVEAGRIALMNYAQEYIYPTVTAALDGAQAAQRAAEAARDALLLNPDYQALTQNLPTIMTLVDNITVLENIRDNMTELLAVSDDLTNIDAVAADLTNLDAIAGNLEEILRSSTYAQQAAQSASQASTSASNAANSATAAAGSATTATNKANEASASATAASSSASNAADSATAAASSATTAADKANTARIWAEGTDGEVVPLGGSHSAKVWAQYVEEIIAGTRIFGGSFDATTATATLTSAAKAKLGTDDNTIVLTNDTTPITGYAANEAIEYVVTVDGTFAGMTLKVNDILWSSGLSWYKIDNSETVIADATESTKGIAELATAAEAEAGANDTKIMTPLKTKQAILELAPTPEDASESTKGVIELAGEGEATGGSNNTKAMTPETTKKAIAAQTYNSLSAAQRTTLLSAGTYMGDTVDSGKIFELDTGKFESFTDTITGSSITWTAGQFPNVSAYWSNRCAYGNGKFVFVSNAGSGYYATYSDDNGATWKSGTLASGITGAWTSVAFGNNVFVAVPDYGSGIYSTDGINWSSSTMPGNDYMDVAFGNGVFVVIPRNRGTGAISSDGINWTALSLSSWQYWNSIAFGNGRFVMISYIQNKAAYSLDGSSWTEVSIPSARTWSRVAYANGKFVAISGDSTCITSIDGATWSSATSTPVLFSEIVAGDGTFIATQSNSNAVYTSTDGVTWTQSTSIAGGGSWFVSGYGDGRFIARKGGNYSEMRNMSSGRYTVTHDYSLTPLSYTKSEVDTALASKQGTLTAGNGIDISSDTISAEEMVGADGINIGKAGAVPRPAATDNTKFLRGDGTWAEAAQEPSYDSSSMTIQL